jgi:hypothetical protein
MKMFCIEFSSEGNILFEKRVAVEAESPAEALDSFWCWIRLQPWYQHAWALNLSMSEILCIDKITKGIRLL